MNILTIFNKYELFLTSVSLRIYLLTSVSVFKSYITIEDLAIDLRTPDIHYQ